MRIARSLKTLLGAVAAAGLAACTLRPDIRVDTDAAIPVAESKTFAFLVSATPEQVRYAAAMKQRLKEATRVALESRGYRYDDESPDLWVNFYLDMSTTTNGTLGIDLIDAHSASLAWHAVAEQRISEKIRRDPGTALDNIVREIFLGFPEARRKL